jgi:uncharacterized protein
LRIVKFTVLDNKNRIILPFKGLKDGLHDFKFNVTNAFFSELDYSEIKEGSIAVNVTMNKKPQHLELEIILEGLVNVMCDRCLGYFNMQVEYDSSLIVKFSKEEGDSEEDFIFLSPEEFEVDLTHYIYESICLSLPYQRVHPDDKRGRSTCDKDMLKKLKQLSMNVQEADDTDPRWEKLKKLK